jgi:hypothetical protein
MKIKKIKLNTSYLSLYIEGEQGLVFNHASKCLYSVPSIIVAYIFTIDDGLSELEAIQDVSQSFNIAPTELMFFYKKALSFFTNSPLTVTYADGKYPELFELKKHSTRNKKNIKTYVVGDTSFSITCADEVLYAQITPVLLPIETRLNEVDFQIEVKQSSANVKYLDIYCNNLQIEEKLLPAEVLPLIIDRMQILTFQTSDYCFCFHGAALQTSKGVLLLPGESGAGKSTLSALLASKQHKLFSDEMIVLDENFKVMALQLPIAVKSGSWNVLSDHYPELNTLPEFLRLDGRQLKYVWPSSFANPKSTNEHTKTLPCIVTPKFTQDIQDSEQAKKISVIDTISVLTTAGYQVGIELDEVKLEKLLSFIENAQCYELTYNSNKQAERELTLIWEAAYDRAD